MSRRLLFYRDFQRYSGGHRKVWDYFVHAGHTPGWSPLVHLTASSRDEDNPWRTANAACTRDWSPDRAEALFLGGLDWHALPEDDPDVPVINLVQHVRHGDPHDPRHRFLARPAIRICVSGEVAQAIESATPRGPVLVIEAGIDLPARPATAGREGVFIDAIKQPELGRALASRLREDGRRVELNDVRIAPSRYLDRLAHCRVAVVLPRATEGFYLPGLEAMALGCATVVPDCIGNRAYLRPEQNALVPPLELGALIHAVERLDESALSLRLAAEGAATAGMFSLEREREAFQGVLDRLPALWRIALES